MNSRRSLVVSLAGTLCCCAGAASAQEQSAAGRAASLLEEITVTAQRREESVQRVPLAVSAFTGEQLVALNITRTLDLVKAVPNLIGHNNTGLGSANTYSLRALSNTESISTFDPPVGTYVDDVLIARQNANNFQFFDVERVEVLRGPQGTTFGRNTTGGAINVILKKPAETFGGYLEAGAGQFGARKLRASLDAPLSANLLTKLSAYLAKDDGYVSNLVTGEDDLNAQDAYGLRAALRWLASDEITWDVSIDYANENSMNLLNLDAESPQQQALPPNPTTGATLGCPGTISRSRFSCTGLRTDRSQLAGLVAGDKQDYPLGNEVEAWSATSNLQWSTNLGRIDFITGYRYMTQHFALDFFNSPAPTGGFTIANEGQHEQFSQEVKIAGGFGERWDYTAGLYYFDEYNRTDFADLFFVGTSVPVPMGTTFVLEDRILRNSTEAAAAYVQADWEFVDDWTLTVGGRYTHETKQIDFEANPYVGPNFSNPRVSTANILLVSPDNATNGFGGPAIPLEQTAGLFTPRIALKWDVTGDANLFASATRGFKSGGWNARGTAPNEIQPFTAEKVWSYEFGVRSQWFGNRLRANLTGFHQDVSDLQLGSAFIRQNGTIAFISRNQGGLRNKGVEIELTAEPIDGLTLFAYIGLQDAGYKDLSATILAQQQQCQASLVAPATAPPAAARLRPNCGAGIVDPRGGIAEPSRAADTFTYGGSYLWRVGASWSLTPTVHVQTIGDQFGATNNADISFVPRHTIYNASLALREEAARWSLVASCDNCSDETTVNSTLAEAAYLNAPRTWGVSFRYDFR